GGGPRGRPPATVDKRRLLIDDQRPSQRPWPRALPLSRPPPDRGEAPGLRSPGAGGSREGFRPFGEESAPSRYRRCLPGRIGFFPLQTPSSRKDRALPVTSRRFREEATSSR